MSDDVPWEPSGRTMEGPPFDDFEDDEDGGEPFRKKYRRSPRLRKKLHHKRGSRLTVH